MGLPSGWVNVRFSDIANDVGVFCDGDWVESKDQDPEGEVRLIQLADVGDGLFCNKSNRYLTFSKAKELNCTFLSQNDVLIARMPHPLGRACVFPFPEDSKYVTVVDVAILRPDNRIADYWFCAYMINAPQIRNAVSSLESGTTRKRISRKNLDTIPIPLPPLAEQHRIVEKIDALFSELDKGVEYLESIKQQMKTYRQAVLKWAFEGRLTSDAIVEPKRLEDLCFFITKGTTPPRSKTTEGGNVPFIKVYNLTFNATLDFSVNPTYVPEHIHTGFLARSKVLPGDVLMNIVGPPLGKVSIVPPAYAEYNINQAIARFRCNDELHNKYLAYYLLFDGTIETVSRKSKATAGQFNLTLEICRNIEIPYLPIEGQTNIVRAIESRLSVCEKLEQLVDENLAKAEALRQSILKKAFEGRLVPQDPNEEPAEKLLERIRAERASQTPPTKRRKKNA